MVIGGVDNWGGSPGLRDILKIELLKSEDSFWRLTFVLLYFGFLGSWPRRLAEVTTKLSSLDPQQRRDLLVKGAQVEGELVFYGTILVNEFTALGKVFNARYPFVTLKHY